MDHGVAPHLFLQRSRGAQRQHGRQEQERETREKPGLLLPVRSQLRHIGQGLCNQASHSHHVSDTNNRLGPSAWTAPRGLSPATTEPACVTHCAAAWPPASPQHPLHPNRRRPWRTRSWVKRWGCVGDALCRVSWPSDVRFRVLLMAVWPHGDPTVVLACLWIAGWRRVVGCVCACDSGGSPGHRKLDGADRRPCAANMADTRILVVTRHGRWLV